VSLGDILGKLGGQQGEQGGIAAISKLFGGTGLQGIMSKLQSSGLGQQVNSWVGTGQNMPVSGSDIKNAVNPDTLQQVAQQQGMSPDQLSQQVAAALPEMVDRATPEGQVPKQGSGLDALTGMFKK
jgi:uncharacterized protein YidB (DUF937 family)